MGQETHSDPCNSGFGRWGRPAPRKCRYGPPQRTGSQPGAGAMTGPTVTTRKKRATKVEARRDFQKSAADLARSRAPQNLKFEREDWALFRTVEGLQQKAGVERGKLRRLALKELADNALDEGVQVRIGELPDDGYFVENDGGGITGTPTELARLFSIS